MTYDLRRLRVHGLIQRLPHAVATKSPRIGRPLSVELSHAWSHGAAVFDDENLVSCAGLVPVMELAEEAGLSDLPDKHVVFRSERIRSGAANPTPKLTSVIAGLLKGAASMVTEGVNTAKAAGATDILVRDQPDRPVHRGPLGTFTTAAMTTDPDTGDFYLRR